MDVSGRTQRSGNAKQTAFFKKVAFSVKEYKGYTSIEIFLQDGAKAMVANIPCQMSGDTACLKVYTSEKKNKPLVYGSVSVITGLVPQSQRKNNY